MASSIPRFLFPRGALPTKAFKSSNSLPSPIFPPSKCFCRKPFGTSTATASTSSSSSSSSAHRPPPAKHTSLDKPDKFRPPSHPARLNRKPPRHYGGPISDAEKARQATKKYPNMMPPEGSFMHWFLHNREIHIWIIFGTLGSMALYTFTIRVRASTFAHLLPPISSFPFEPISFVQQYWHVFLLQTEHNTQETVERRRRRQEDVQKQMAYRKHHGYDVSQGLDPWPLPEKVVKGQEEGEGEGKVGGEVERRPKRKVWLGIW